MPYFIDTSIFLEVLLKQERKEESKEFLRKVQSGEIEAFTTDFIIDSILIIMERKKCKPKDLLKFLMNIMLFEGLTIYSLNIVDRIIATKYMEKLKLSFDDSTSYVAMLGLGLKEIVSFDTDFDNIEGIKRIEPKDI